MKQRAQADNFAGIRLYDKHRHWILLLLVLLVMLPGCGATRITLGARELDLSKIQVGDTRRQVQKKLGKPFWRPGHANGLTYDVYEYEVARPPDPFSGAIAFTVDLFTLGLSESVLNDLVKVSPRKQVAVTYDQDDRVHFISEPWFIRGGTPSAARRMRAVLPANSGVPFNARPAPGDAADAMAVLKGIGWVTSIDGRGMEQDELELEPGRHTVHYGGKLSSIYYNENIEPTYDTAVIELLAGRVYRVRSELNHFIDQGISIFWIEDAETREVLCCTFPVPPESQLDPSVNWSDQGSK